MTTTTESTIDIKHPEPAPKVKKAKKPAVKKKKIPLGTLTIVKSKKKKKPAAKKPAPKKPKAPHAKKPKKITFDYKSLSRDVLNKRLKENLSFRSAEKITGVKGHILFSIEVGKQVPTCVNMAKVLTWLGRSANTYFVTIAKSK